MRGRVKMWRVREVMQVQNINDRIALIVRSTKLTKTAFAEKVNLSQSHVSRLVSGETAPSDRTIADICRVFGVNETWLRTGEGEMRQQRSREEEIGEIAERASTVDPEKARAFFQRALDGFTDAEIMAIYQIMRQRFPEK